ncbi:hypothetical protein Aduo_005614 [Ancylostoma duodenale]
MLRRSFARTGVPHSVTCDNGLTFTLRESVLVKCIRAAKADLTAKEIEASNGSISHPRKGRFYELWIKWFKYLPYKTVGKRMLTFVELSTLIIGIEALLNTLPLMYVKIDTTVERILRHR